MVRLLLISLFTVIGMISCENKNSDELLVKPGLLRPNIHNKIDSFVKSNNEYIYQVFR